MRKILSVAIALCITLSNTAAHAADDETFSDYEYEANEGHESYAKAPLGYQSSSAANTTIGLSMVGWGLGLAVAIAVVAAVIHQSVASHSGSSSNASS
ncbi:MAG: hypothetical protein AAGE99_00605 [Chlamydiota bacterium]